MSTLYVDRHNNFEINYNPCGRSDRVNTSLLSSAIDRNGYLINYNPCRSSDKVNTSLYSSLNREKY